MALVAVRDGTLSGRLVLVMQRFVMGMATALVCEGVQRIPGYAPE